MKRKRSKVGRYDPKLVKELRVEMAKCPNPVYGQMVAEGNMNDADMMDFALSLSCSYFSGVLLRIFEDTAKANMTLQMRRAVLVTAALFGATADFDNDGMRIMLLGDDSDLITFAVQQLVDTGMSVAEAMRHLEPPPAAQCQMESDIDTQLPEIVEAVH